MIIVAGESRPATVRILNAKQEVNGSGFFACKVWWQRQQGQGGWFNCHLSCIRREWPTTFRQLAFNKCPNKSDPDLLGLPHDMVLGEKHSLVKILGTDHEESVLNVAMKHSIREEK